MSDETVITAQDVAIISVPDQGPPGNNATIEIGTVTTGVAGSSAAVTDSGTPSAAVLDFVIPRGDKGDHGDPATVAVGTVSTGTAGSDVSVENDGNAEHAVLHFVIPRGDDGYGGWSPVLASVVDGVRCVLRVVDWVGGQGDKPATGQYLGSTALVTDIADGTDVRGPAGEVSDAQLNAAISAVVGAAPTTLDTLKELSDALGADANFASTMATALGNRLRFDAAQTLTTGQKSQAISNLGITLGSAAGLDVGTTALNVVQLNSDAKLPAVDGSLLTGISANGVLISRVFYGSSNSALAIPAGANAALVRLWGGTGGAGGNANTTYKGARPGLAAAYAEKWLTGLTAGNTINLAVGAAGSGGTGFTQGGTGGYSAISSGSQTISTVIAYGGGGGSGYSGDAENDYYTTDGAPGTASGGDVNASGVQTGAANWYTYRSFTPYAFTVGGASSLTMTGNNGVAGGCWIDWYKV